MINSDGTVDLDYFPTGIVARERIWLSLLPQNTTTIPVQAAFADQPTYRLGTYALGPTVWEATIWETTV